MAHLSHIYEYNVHICDSRRITFTLFCIKKNYISDTQLLEVKEYYNNRKDKLVQKTHDFMTGWITEYFDNGRHKHLKGITNVCYGAYPGS